MRIGELSTATDESAHTLRFWEQRGLLPDPGRTASGYRDYPPDAIERVTFIRRAQSAGLTLDQIRTVLDVDDRGHRPCAQISTFVDQRLTDVDARLAELAHTRAQLAALRDRLNALDGDESADATRRGVCPAID